MLALDAGEWPIKQARAQSAAVIVDDLAARFGDLPTGGWDIPPRPAIVVPIAEQAQNQPAGAMVIGLNPYRPLDDAYRGFIHLLAGQIAAGLADVRAYGAGTTARLYLPRLIVAESGDGDRPPPRGIPARNQE